MKSDGKSIFLSGFESVTEELKEKVKNVKVG
jgi:hypothetical protein